MLVYIMYIMHMQPEYSSFYWYYNKIIQNLYML